MLGDVTSLAPARSSSEKIEKGGPVSDEESSSMPAGTHEDSSTIRESSVGVTLLNEEKQNQQHETEEEPPPPDDSNDGALSPLFGIVPEFHAVLRLGIMACRYGALGFTVESYLVELLKIMGYNGTVVITNVDLQFSVYRKTTCDTEESDDQESQVLLQESSSKKTTAKNVQLPFTVSLNLESQNDFSKLVAISSICADVLHQQIDLEETSRRLTQLEARPRPWNFFVQCVAYIATPPGFVVILKGSRTDIWLSFLGGILTFGSIELFESKWPTKKQTFGMFVAAVLPAMLATAASLSKNLEVNIVSVTIAAIIVEVPGFPTLIGISELAKNRILAGLGHWIKAFLTAAWLAFGAWLGMEFILAIAGKKYDDTIISEADPINEYWYFLVAPVLGFCFSVSFLVGWSELPMSIAVCLIAFGMSLSIEHFSNENLGNIVAAFVTTLVAQVWGRSWHEYLCRRGSNKEPTPNPSIIVLLPAFFILVGGSIGVRGFATILEGDTENGEEILLQFLLVPALLVLGIYLGQSLIPATSVLK